MDTVKSIVAMLAVFIGLILSIPITVLIIAYQQALINKDWIENKMTLKNDNN